MRFVLAPDSFKESMTAIEAVAAMRRGVLAVLPDAECVDAPMSDGGEGRESRTSTSTPCAAATACSGVRNLGDRGHEPGQGVPVHGVRPAEAVDHPRHRGPGVRVQPTESATVRGCPAARGVDISLTSTPKALPPRGEKGPLTRRFTLAAGSRSVAGSG